jgi:alkylation response protein AidB-like acyl-CoA dehydrogenase
MDLRLSPDDVAFREEVRAFFRTAVPPALRRKVENGIRPSRDEHVAWVRTLDDRGWAVPAWPVEHGGTGWSALRRLIFQEEMFLANAPQPPAFGPTMIGPVLIAFGTEAQKRRFLPPIRRLDEWWCQGFSEPGAGSDLAGLRTTATRDGDDWIIDGQKTWTTYAHYADWIFVLARTDPAAKKQEGIGFFMVAMTSPGITVRPIITMDGGHEVNEVWFDRVRVPADQLVGEPTRGWDYAKFLLANERTGIARLGFTKERLRQLRRLAAGERSEGGPLSQDPRFAEELAALEVQVKALELTQLRVAMAEAKRGANGRPDPASSILKLKGTELQQAATAMLMRLAAPYGMPDATMLAGVNDPPDLPDFALHAPAQYLNWRKVSIYGGSNEIQRNILAKAVLGL